MRNRRLECNPAGDGSSDGVQQDDVGSANDRVDPMVTELWRAGGKRKRPVVIAGLIALVATASVALQLLGDVTQFVESQSGEEFGPSLHPVLYQLTRDLNDLTGRGEEVNDGVRLWIRVDRLDIGTQVASTSMTLFVRDSTWDQVLAPDANGVLVPVRKLDADRFSKLHWTLNTYLGPNRARPNPGEGRAADSVSYDIPLSRLVDAPHTDPRAPLGAWHGTVPFPVSSTPFLYPNDSYASTGEVTLASGDTVYDTNPGDHGTYIPIHVDAQIGEGMLGRTTSMAAFENDGLNGYVEHSDQTLQLRIGRRPSDLLFVYVLCFLPSAFAFLLVHNSQPERMRTTPAEMGAILVGIAGLSLAILPLRGVLLPAEVAQQQTTADHLLALNVVILLWFALYAYVRHLRHARD